MSVPPFGIAVLAIAVLSVMDALIKHATASLGTLQIVGLRYLFGLAFALPLALPALVGGIAREAWRAGALRGTMMVATGTCFFFALGRLELVEAVVLTFSAPIWTAIVARLLLGEPVSSHAAAGIALGFVGVVVIAVGSGGVGGEGAADEAGAAARAPDPLGVAAALAAALCYALAFVLVRRSMTRDGAAVTVLLQTFAAFVVAAPFALATAEPLARGQWALFALVGALGTGGHLLLARSLARARAAEIVIADYTSLVWALAIGWWVFAETPKPAQLAGAVLVAAGCAVVMRRARPEPAPAAGP